MLISFDETTGIKRVISKNYNYQFNTNTGEFARWGATFNDDPKAGYLEIFDLEVSEVCNGIPSPGETVAVPCAHCYKSNTKSGRNMSFETFKNIFDKLPKTLTQIAFGIGDMDANPDLVKMFDYCHNNTWNPKVIPNITINGYGLTSEWVDTLKKYCGGVAVSRYENKDVCYDAIKSLTDAGISQVNIHMVIANENIDQCYDVINDAINDPRLSKMKAIVFLTLKPKGKRNKWTTIKDVNVYRDLVKYAMDNGIGIGFDSCSAPTFLASMKDHPKFELFSQLSESCESTLFSGYANVTGEFFPCSFTETERGWMSGVNLTTIEDFNKDVWNHPRVVEFRNKNIKTAENATCGGDCRLCVTFPDLYDKSLYNHLPDSNYIPILPSRV